MLLPGRDGDLGEAGQQDGGGQANKGDDRSLQKVHLTHQDIRGLGAGRNLPHEVHVDLKDRNTQRQPHLKERQL